MKIKISNIALAAAMLTVASCSEHWTPPTGSDGSLALGSMIVDVKENANVIVSSGSRAAADESHGSGEEGHALGLSLQAAYHLLCHIGDMVGRCGGQSVAVGGEKNHVLIHMSL